MSIAIPTPVGDGTNGLRRLICSSSVSTTPMAAPTANEPSVGQRAQHLCEMMVGHAEALREVGRRQCAVGIARQLEHGVEAEPCRRLQLHAGILM